MTKALFSDFFSKQVLHFISDRSIDFQLDNLDEPFNSVQKKFIRRNLELDSSKIINVKQVHGDEIISVTNEYSRICEADAVLTNLKNCPIAIRTADCLPVFLFDSKSQTIGLVHAGWRGAEKKIVEKVITKMVTDFGVCRENILAALGPRISSDNYEVSEEFIEYFPEDVVSINGKYYFDLGQANKKQLSNSGVHKSNVFDCDICTYASPEYFSYRREGVASGRILSLMMLRG